MRLRFEGPQVLQWACFYHSLLQKDLWAEGGHAVKGDKGKGRRSSIRKVGDLAVCSHPLAEQGQERMKDELWRS